jgi:hypothetical protein
MYLYHQELAAAPLRLGKHASFLPPWFVSGSGPEGEGLLTSQLSVN